MQPPGTMIDERSTVYFFSPSELARRALFHPISAGEFHCTPSYSIDRRSSTIHFNNFLLLYTMSGQGKLVFEGKTYRARAGDVMLVNCYKPHLYAAEDWWHILWLHFDGPAAGELFHWIFSNRGCVMPLRDIRGIHKSIRRRILQSQKQSNLMPEPTLSLLIHRMLSELLNDIPGYNSERSSERPYISDAIAFIRENLRDSIKVTDIAAHVNISIYHFSRLFKKETGFSPHQYMTCLRMERAKVLLQTNNCNLKKIALEIGLQSETSFIRLFQRMTGFSPTEFRKMQLKPD